MSLTPTSTQPSSPEDPDLRDRYARDAWQQREARRLSAERAAAEVPPSHTPAGPIRVIAALVALGLVLVAATALVGPMLRQSETTDHGLPAGISRVELGNGVGDVRIRVAEAGETPRVTSTIEWGLRRPTADVAVAGDTATLQGRCPAGPVTVCATDWLVVVPAGTDLDIEQGVGGVRVDGMAGDLAVESGVGDVRVTNARSQEIDVQQGVGALRVEAVDPPRNLRARVGVGDLTVRLPDTVDYAIDANGGASEVRNSLGSTPAAQRRVVLETGVGSLTVEPA